MIQLDKLIENSKKSLSNFPYELASKDAMDQKLRTLNQNFIDIDFPPNDSSLYDPNLDSPFDTLIHWR